MYELKNYEGYVIGYINPKNIVTLRKKIESTMFGFADLYINEKKNFLYDFPDIASNEEKLVKVEQYVDKIIRELSDYVAS